MSKYICEQRGSIPPTPQKIKFKIMTLNELIQQLQEIVKQEPERGDLPLYVFPLHETDIEDINEIYSIDNEISDRIDINIGRTRSYIVKAEKK